MKTINVSYIDGNNIVKNNDFYKIEKETEKAILIGKEKESVHELAQLANTAKVNICSLLYHSRDKINSTYYIGTGKLNELKEAVSNLNCNLVIFDHELSPAQHRNLEEDLNTNVIDRTQLILNIFSEHAHTKESKLQVEKAQLEYLLPRLTGKGKQLSRLAGGIGTRGPGETKLEVDRRRIDKRIHRLKEKLKKIRQNREIQRQDRKDPLVALVGYTNAGKSTLLNLLTNSDNYVADKLFATLDSTLRKMKLPNGRQIILSDTVGFIRNLPHQLVASFQATLEEIATADLILHVVDCSDPQAEKHIKVTNDVLKNMGANKINKLMVFNKIDKIDKNELKKLELQHPEHLSISAFNKSGRKKLINKITEYMNKDMVEVKLILPYNQANIVETLHNNGKVLKEHYTSENIHIKAVIPEKLANIISKHNINNNNT